VALQVHPAQPADVAEQGLVEPHHPAQEAGVGHELLHGILRRGRVGRGALVPARLVQHSVIIGHVSAPRLPSTTFDPGFQITLMPGISSVASGGSMFRGRLARSPAR
jgi:hypothetical protein